MKLVKILVAAAVMTAMVAPAIAEDRLKLSGEMRVRGWHTDYDGDDFTSTWADQRLRIFGNIAVAEGVSVQFRTDVTERAWGNGGSAFGAGRMPQDGQQWDRAYLDLKKGNFHLRAGQQYVGFGLTQAVNSQDAGISFDYNAGLPIKGFFILDNNGGGEQLNDALLYGLATAFKGDGFSSNVFASLYNDGNQAEVYLLGADLATNLGAVKLAGEFNFFTGDATDTVDAMGTQLFLDASMAATDTVTVGGQFYYAKAADADEQQYVVLGNDFNGWDPLMDVGTSLSNESITAGRPFDFTGTGSGVVGGRLYVSSKLSDALKVGASAAFLTVEDDQITDTDATVLAAGLTYALMANTSFQLQLQYYDVDVDGESGDAFEAGTGLFVSF